MTEIPMPGDAMTQPTGERPLGVAILAVLNWLQALLLLVGGVIVLALPFFGVVLGAVAILVGLFLFYIGLGLWNMRGWAWMWAMLVNILGLIINFAGSQWIALAINIIIIVYLNAPDIRRVFR
ncbi:MAG: hypothetical protein ACFFEU_10720 [Candidatus Thorarchaeota archaeon]